MSPITARGLSRSPSVREETYGVTPGAERNDHVVGAEMAVVGQHHQGRQLVGIGVQTDQPRCFRRRVHLSQRLEKHVFLRDVSKGELVCIAHRQLRALLVRLPLPVGGCLWKGNFRSRRGHPGTYRRNRAYLSPPCSPPCCGRRPLFYPSPSRSAGTLHTPIVHW